MIELPAKRPWVIVVLVFAALVAAWTTLVVIARRNPPVPVPLEHTHERAP
jgi:hypothetical protein